MPTYNKLVRDNILDIIAATGKKYNSSVLDNDDYLAAIKKKFLEEAKEVSKATTDEELVEELADITELIYAALKKIDVSKERLEEVRIAKNAKNGGFDKGFFLIDVED